MLLQSRSKVRPKKNVISINSGKPHNTHGLDCPSGSGLSPHSQCLLGIHRTLSYCTSMDRGRLWTDLYAIGYAGHMQDHDLGIWTWWMRFIVPVSLHRVCPGQKEGDLERALVVVVCEKRWFLWRQLECKKSCLKGSLVKQQAWAVSQEQPPWVQCSRC